MDGCLREWNPALHTRSARRSLNRLGHLLQGMLFEGEIKAMVVDGSSGRAIAKRTWRKWKPVGTALVHIDDIRVDLRKGLRRGGLDICIRPPGPEMQTIGRVSKVMHDCDRPLF